MLLVIRNLDHNLYCIVVYYRYTDPSHFDGLDVVGDSTNRMDGSADGNYPYMNHFVDTHTIFANNVALSPFDHNKNQHSLGTFAVYANCQTVHLGHCLSLQNAINWWKRNWLIISVAFYYVLDLNFKNSTV